MVSVGYGGVGGRVEFSSHGAINGLYRNSTPPWHTSPAILRYLHTRVREAVSKSVHIITNRSYILLQWYHFHCKQFVIDKS